MEPEGDGVGALTDGNRAALILEGIAELMGEIATSEDSGLGRKGAWRMEWLTKYLNALVTATASFSDVPKPGICTVTMTPRAEAKAAVA
jgi:hypothetical protein